MDVKKIKLTVLFLSFCAYLLPLGVFSIEGQEVVAKFLLHDIQETKFNFKTKPVPGFNKCLEEGTEGKLSRECVREEIKVRRKEKNQEQLEAKKEEKRKPTATELTSGKGVWVNLWNYPEDLTAFMSKLKHYDVDTIYLQVNRSTTPVFKHQERLDKLLFHAHHYNIKVIGWSYCYLRDIASDVRKYVEPALYVSPQGHSLDGMAADIEENTDLGAVKQYTGLVKQALPEGYPLLAIVFAPRIRRNYPWQYIGENWDVLMPMAYWHGMKRQDTKFVADFIGETIDDLRSLTGREDLQVHLITDGDRTTAAEVKESLKAAKKFGVNAGVSIYPEHLASDEMLEVLREF